MIRAVVSRCAIWRSKPGDPLPPLRLSPSRPQEVGRTPRRGGPGLKLALSTKARRWACEGVAPASRFGTVRTTPRLRHLWRGVACLGTVIRAVAAKREGSLHRHQAWGRLLAGRR